MPARSSFTLMLSPCLESPASAFATSYSVFQNTHIALYISLAYGDSVHQTAPTMRQRLEDSRSVEDSQAELRGQELVEDEGTAFQG